MSRKDWTPAFRRYQYRVIVASLLYAVALIGVVWLFKHHPPQGALAYAAAVAPALPLVGVFVALGLFLREETDEYQRHLMVGQILVGAGGTLIVATIYGFIESFVGVHHFEAYWVAIVWFFFFGVGRCVRGVL